MRSDDNRFKFSTQPTNGNAVTLPWQPSGGQAAIKSAQQPAQSAQQADGSANGVAESYMKNWTAYDGNKRAGNTQFWDSSANQSSGNQGGMSGAFLTAGNASAGTQRPEVGAAQQPSDGNWLNYNGNKMAGNTWWQDHAPNLGQLQESGGTQSSIGGNTGGMTWSDHGVPNDRFWDWDTAGGGNRPGGSTPQPPAGGDANQNPLDPGTGAAPGGATGGNASSDLPTGGGTGEAGDTTGAADTSGTTGTTGSTTGTNKTIYDWFKEYLEKLGNYKTPSATSQEEMIRQMYEASLAANKSQLESDYNQNLSDLDAEASTIGSTYYEQQRQAQAQSDRNRQAFQEYANARGLNSGTGGQAELAQQNQLSANMNNLRQSEAEKRAEIERQRVLLGQQYQSAIQKAQADNDLNLAKALYEEAVRVDESLTSAAKADADRALQMFNILNNSVMNSADSNASAYAELLGISGGSTEQLNELYDKATQIKTTGGYYVSNGSGGTTFKQATSGEIEQAEYYINLINLAGGVDRVKEYILGHYKELQSDTGGKIGYQERFQIGTAYQERAGKFSNKIYQIGTDLGKGIADGLAPGQSYTNTKDGSVWERSPINGKLYITKDGVTMEASYQEGYKG